MYLDVKTYHYSAVLNYLCLEVCIAYRIQVTWSHGKTVTFVVYLLNENFKQR